MASNEVSKFYYDDEGNCAWMFNTGDVIRVSMEGKRFDLGFDTIEQADKYLAEEGYLSENWEQEQEDEIIAEVKFTYRNVKDSIEHFDFIFSNLNAAQQRRKRRALELKADKLEQFALATGIEL